MVLSRHGRWVVLIWRRIPLGRWIMMVGNRPVELWWHMLEIWKVLRNLIVIVVLSSALMGRSAGRHMRTSLVVHLLPQAGTLV